MAEKLDIRLPMRVGQWTLLEEATADKHGNRRFWAECTCGSRSVVLLCGLRAGKSKGCRNCCMTGHKQRAAKRRTIRKQAAAARNADAKEAREIKRNLLKIYGIL